MKTAELPQISDGATPQTPSPLPGGPGWESLCEWLSRDLRGFCATVERQTSDSGRMLESGQYPLESVFVHRTPNGVQTISIALNIHGVRRLFQIAGANSVRISRNAAGFPLAVEFGADDSKMCLVFSGKVESALAHSGNWGE